MMRKTLVAAAALMLGGAALAGPAGKPAVGDFGFDTTGMDRSVKPGDDFNAFANGAWMKRTTIPSDHDYWGVWDELDEKAYTQVRAILEDAAAAHAPVGSNAQKIGDFYASFVDQAAIDAKGATPLGPQLAAVARIADDRQLAAAMGAAMFAGEDMPVGAGVGQDFKRPDRYMVYIGQGGLGLPDRDYYLKSDADTQKAQAAYRTYAAQLLRLAGLSASDADAAARAQAVYDAEAKLAQGQWSRVQLRDPVATYTPWPRADFATKAPGFAWDDFFAAAGVASQPTLVAYGATSLVATAKLIPAVPIAVWRDYMAIRAIDAHANTLAKPFVDAHFGFHSTALAGTPEQKARWKRGVIRTEGALGEAVGQIYVARYFDASAKAAALDLTGNLLAAMGRHIDALDWMTPATKAEAHVKLAAFARKIGYPDKWRDYSAMRIVRGDAYGNALEASRFEYQRGLDKLGKPVDRTEWDMPPMTVNAYYNPSMNEIVFPAAVLQPPFFDPAADPAVNYGGIGAIMGHEISHGFDDEGRQFDDKGALRDWWSPADAAAFKQRAAALVAQYGAYESLPGLHLNGELTLGENIADTAGVTIAYDAYHASLGGKPAPVIDGLTGDQRFFLGYAQVWRTLWRDNMLRQAQATDPHTPDPLRPQTVRNFDAWYDAFGAKPGDKLYLAPAQRVHIW